MNKVLLGLAGVALLLVSMVEIPEARNEYQGGCSTDLQCENHTVFLNCDGPYTITAKLGIPVQQAFYIVDDRLRFGPYRSFYDLQRVEGLSDHTLAQIGADHGISYTLHCD